MGSAVRYAWRCSASPKGRPADAEPCTAAQTSYTSAKIEIAAARELLPANLRATNESVLLTWTLSVSSTAGNLAGVDER